MATTKSKTRTTEERAEAAAAEWHAAVVGTLESILETADDLAGELTSRRRQSPLAEFMSTDKHDWYWFIEHLKDVMFAASDVYSPRHKDAAVVPIPNPVEMLKSK